MSQKVVQKTRLQYIKILSQSEDLHFKLRWNKKK